MSNDLNELNNILFDTLRGVKEGTIDNKQANAVIGLSNSLVNNAKVQIQAMKLTGHRTPTKFLSLNGTPGKPREKYDAKLQFAKDLGYDSVAEAMSHEGKEEFDKQFNIWKG